MKGWLYVISNRAVAGMVKVGATPRDPITFAASLDKSGLPFPHEVGYEALVPEMEDAEKAIVAALSGKAAGKGWYTCSVIEAVRVIVSTVGHAIMVETRHDPQSCADKMAEDVSSFNPRKRASILANPDCPLNVLRFAAEREEDEGVLQTMLANPACMELGDETLKHVVTRLADRETVLRAIASDPRMSPSVLQAVLENAGKSSEVVLALARNRRLASETLVELIENYANPTIAAEVVARSDCTAETLALLVWIHYDDETLKRLVRSQPQWSEDTFVSLLRKKAADTECSSAAWVADHPDCPRFLLETLWSHPDQEVKQAVLENPACPEGILIEASIVDHERAEPDIDVEHLAQVARDNPSNPLSRPLTASSETEFRLLANSCHPQAVLRAASHPLCPPSILFDLARHHDIQVRQAVADNDAVDEAILAVLADDECDEVRSKVAECANCPVESLRVLAYDSNGGVRLAAVINPRCPQEILEEYAEHDLYEWRSIVLDNPACPDSIVERLTMDANHLIRSTAKRLRDRSPVGEPTVEQPEESIESLRDRFKNYVRKKHGAVLEEAELLRLSNLTEPEKQKFASEHPSMAKQLALFERYILPRL